MSHSLNSILKVVLSAGLLAVLAGCAARAQDTSALEQQIQEARAEAQEANQAATEARARSEAALKAANEAKSMAADALGAARSAQQTADQNSQRIDRMFRQSITK